MKKFYLFVLSLSIGSVIAQKHEHFRDQFGNMPCYTDHHMEELKQDPATKQAIEQSQQELEDFTQYYIENEYNPNSRGTLYTIPIVFHILHTGGVENISDEQIYDALDRINEDFNKMNNNWQLVQSAFLPLVADIEVEFKLAKKKPDGTCFKGITRTFSFAAWGSGGEQVAAVQAAHGNFASNRYLNVFVVPYANGAAGYTNYPFSQGGNTMNKGIYILHDYTGRIGTSSNFRSTALSHEIGHWFNLRHPWGNSNDPGVASNCNIDDEVADTPLTVGWTSCDLDGESCGSLDNVENYMEYSYCSKMFTEGQKARMHAALNSNTGGRNNLHTTSNLLQTGVNDPLVFCRADFRSNITTVCPGAEIQFIDESVHNATTWNWSFPGGTPSSSTDQNPVVTYSTPGTYSVSLTAGDGNSTDTKTVNAFITVIPQSVALPYVESFASYSSIATSNNKWRVNNFGNDNSWQIFNGAGYTDTKSVRLQNLNEDAGGIDELISQSFDLSGLDSTDVITMSFATSYKRVSSTSNDKLRVLISTDCGETWSTRRTLTTLNMSVGDFQTTNWTPSNSNDWRLFYVTNINSSFYQPSVLFKFEFTSADGNNIFLDEINLFLEPTSSIGLEEQLANANTVNLFPNPTVNQLTVDLELQTASEFDIQIVDLSGKVIYAQSAQGTAGSNTVLLDSSILAPGMYMIRVEGLGAPIVKPFVKK